MMVISSKNFTEKCKSLKDSSQPIQYGVGFVFGTDGYYVINPENGETIDEAIESFIGTKKGTNYVTPSSIDTCFRGDINISRKTNYGPFSISINVRTPDKRESGKISFDEALSYQKASSDLSSFFQTASSMKIVRSDGSEESYDSIGLNRKIGLITSFEETGVFYNTIEAKKREMSFFVKP